MHAYNTTDDIQSEPRRSTCCAGAGSCGHAATHSFVGSEVAPFFEAKNCFKGISVVWTSDKSTSMILTLSSLERHTLIILSYIHCQELDLMTFLELGCAYSIIVTFCGPACERRRLHSATLHGHTCMTIVGTIHACIWSG